MKKQFRSYAETKLIKKKNQAAVRIQGNVRIRYAKLESSFMLRFTLKKEEAAVRIQSMSRSVSSRKLTNMEHIGHKHHTSVIAIQSACRCHLARAAFDAVSHSVFRTVASEFACRIQTNIRQCLARRHLSKLKNAMKMMQQWAARYCWNRTVDFLTKIAATEWRTICAHTTTLYGRKEAFSKAQVLAPAVIPSWWLSHFPLTLTNRVDLKREPLVALDNQIRRDRIKTLGGIGDFQETLQLLSSLVNNLTGGFRVKSFDLTASYDLLVSLIAFCNIRGTDIVSERSFTASTQDTSLEKCRQLGIEMLKYAVKEDYENSKTEIKLMPITLEFAKPNREKEQKQKE